MERLIDLTRSLSADLAERHASAAPDQLSYATDASHPSRLAACLLRWVETRGMDGELLLVGWELGGSSHRREDGVAGLTDRIARSEHLLAEAMERAAAAARPPLGIAEVLELARWVRAGVTMLTRTALKGFIVGREGGHRRWLRDLRHDLRNPIGAIKNAVSLLEETSPELGGTAQRLCSIAARNATTLEGLVRHRAAEEADSDAIQWGGRAQPADVVDRVLAALREGGDAVARRLPAPRAMPGVQVDAIGFEIALHAALRRALAAPSVGVALGMPRCDDQDGAGGTLELRIGLVRGTADAASPNDGDSGDEASRPLLDLARAAVEGSGGRMGGDPWEPDGLVMTLPLLGGRDQRYDLGGARESDHWQPGAL